MAGAREHVEHPGECSAIATLAQRSTPGSDPQYHLSTARYQETVTQVADILPRLRAAD